MQILKKIGLAAFCLLLAVPAFAARCPVILLQSQYASLTGETFAVVYVDKNHIQILRQTEDGSIVGDSLPIVDGSPDTDSLEVIRDELAAIPKTRIFAFAADGAGAMSGLDLNFQAVPMPIDTTSGKNSWVLSLVNVASDRVVREKMKQFAVQLEPVYQEYKDAYEDLQPIFGPYLMQISFRKRAKELSSIERKLQHKALEKNMPILSLQHARSVIGDGVGFRVVLKLPSESSHRSLDKLLESIVQNLANRIESGSIQVTEIHNYHAPHAKPYLSGEQVLRLYQASEKTGKPIDVEIKHGSMFRLTGYTSLNLNIVLPSGIPAELQIRGEVVDRLAEIEHIYYNFRSKKTVSTQENPEMGEFLDALATLDAEKRTELNNYLTSYYIYARAIETEGHNSKTQLKKPILPDGLPPILSIENVAAMQGLTGI